jgi:UDP-galactopyranose mutase
MKKYIIGTDRERIEKIERVNHELHKMFETNYTSKKWHDIIESQTDSDLLTRVDYVFEDEKLNQHPEAEQIREDLTYFEISDIKPEKFKP